MLNKDEVKGIADLARLGLSSEELDKFSGQLSSVFEYIDVLNELDTDNVKPTFQVTGLENVKREDEVKIFCERDEILSVSELPMEDHQIKVKNVF